MKTKFGLKESRLLACLLLAAALPPFIGALFIISIPLPVRVILSAAMLFLFAVAIRHHALLRGKSAVRGVVFLPGGGMEVAANDGIWRGNLSEARLSPLLSVFVVKCGRRTFNVLVAPDSMDKNSCRQLRVQLDSEKQEGLNSF